MIACTEPVTRDGPSVNSPSYTLSFTASSAFTFLERQHFQAPGVGADHGGDAGRGEVARAFDAQPRLDRAVALVVLAIARRCQADDRHNK